MLMLLQQMTGIPVENDPAGAKLFAPAKFDPTVSG